jgi:hypothetical protein
MNKFLWPPCGVDHFPPFAMATSLVTTEKDKHQICSLVSIKATIVVASLSKGIFALICHHCNANAEA